MKEIEIKRANLESLGVGQLAALVLPVGLGLGTSHERDLNDGGRAGAKDQLVGVRVLADLGGDWRSRNKNKIYD